MYPQLAIQNTKRLFNQQPYFLIVYSSSATKNKTEFALQTLNRDSNFILNLKKSILLLYKSPL